jgi:hypothetical protein
MAFEADFVTRWEFDAVSVVAVGGDLGDDADSSFGAAIGLDLADDLGSGGDD